jgi:hypothetical protein
MAKNPTLMAINSKSFMGVLGLAGVRSRLAF